MNDTQVGSPKVCFSRDSYLVYESRRDSLNSVMPALVAGIHVFAGRAAKDVDGRNIAPRSRAATAGEVLATLFRHQAATVPKKSRGAERRKAQTHVRPRLRGAAAHLAIGALAFRRSTAALVAATERVDSAQAVLHAMKCEGVTFAFGSRLSGVTPRAGRNAGGIDARTARERRLQAPPAGTAFAP